MTFQTFAILFIGLVVLILGGNYLVKGACNIALRLHISPLVVGLTIVAFGTSAPELLISVRAALSGSPDLTMGNVIGSNICNLALVLGVTALISPIHVKSNSIKIDWPMTMGSSLLLYLLVREGFVDSYEGVLFISLLVTYTVFVIWKSRKEHAESQSLLPDGVESDTPTTAHLLRDLFFIALGCLGLFYGSEWFVGSAQDIAVYFGVSERIIGITVLALGTSLPELVTAMVASYRKETDLALGNLMGSNIFNILSILGITSIIKSIEVDDVIVSIDLVWMLGITLVILPMMLYRRKVSRIEGAILLTIYFVYISRVVM